MNTTKVENGTTAPLVASILSSVGGDTETIVGDTLEAALRIKARARCRRLPCYRVAATCPVESGLTYRCRSCAEPVTGKIGTTEALLEVMLLAVGDIFRLGVGS
jgi:hypothetical protein